MNKVFKKISADTFVYSILPQVPKLMNFLLLPLTTPFLSSMDFAVFGTVMAFVMGFDIIKTLALDVVLMNSFFKQPESYAATWRKVQAFISVWSFVITLLVGGVLYFVLPKELTDGEKVFVIVTTGLPSFLFAGLSKVSVLLYQYRQNPKPIVMRSVVLGLLAVALNYYFIVVLKIGYKGWFYSGLITGVLMPLSYLYPIWVVEKLTPLYTITRSEFMSMLKVSLPIIPHHYANYFLNYSDRVLLSMFQVASAQVGLYNLAYSVAGNFRIFSNAVDKVLGPLFHKNLTANGNVKIIFETVFVLAALYLFLGFLGGLWMKEFFQLLIRNEELIPSHSVATIVLFSFVTRPLYNGAQSFLFFEEKTGNLWRVTFMFGVANIILNIVFIPVYGIYAAAINTFVCITGSNYGVFLLKDYKSTTKLNFYQWRWLTFTLFLLAVCWLLKEVTWWVKAGVSLGATVVLVSFVFLVRRRSFV